MLELLKSYQVQGNLTRTFPHGLMTWKVKQRKCVARYCELANKTTQHLYKVATPCIDDPEFKEEEMGSVGELSKVCSQIVLKSMYLERIGKLEILWSVNKVARAITKWTRVCDKHLARLISYIQHTCEFKQYCHVGNTAQQCRLELFQDSDLQVILKTQSQHQVHSCAFSEVTRSCNKLDVQETDFSLTQFDRI